MAHFPMPFASEEAVVMLSCCQGNRALNSWLHRKEEEEEEERTLLFPFRACYEIWTHYQDCECVRTEGLSLKFTSRIVCPASLCLPLF